MEPAQQEALWKQLFALQDLGYREFHSRLMPTVPKEKVIGVRTPQLRRLAKQLAGGPMAGAFLQSLPHRYYEEDNLHGLLINSMKEFEEAVKAVEELLPWLDNWASCDLLCPKAFSQNLPALLPHVRSWLDSAHPYTIRFGVGCLMRFYLGEAFREEYLQWAARLQSEEYYVNMMIAWYFATALSKQWAATLPYLQGRRLAPWTHNKAIQKALESYRISEPQKAYLRTLKVGRANKD